MYAGNTCSLEAVVDSTGNAGDSTAREMPACPERTGNVATQQLYLITTTAI